MLNIDEIQNGIVIDHIKAGTAVGLMELLGITGNKTANVALIQNARSHKADCGRKDIIKVEGDASWLNLDVLAYLDPDISVTVIENGKAVRKEKPKPTTPNSKAVEKKLRAVEREVEKQEAAVAAYDPLIEAAASDYQELTRLMAEKAGAETQLSQLMEQWEALSLALEGEG